jgi:hypothetical protein
MLGKCMQFPGRQVLAPIHANKMAKMRRDGVLLHSTRWPECIWPLSGTTDPTSAKKPRTYSELKNMCFSGESECILYLRSSLCVGSLSQSRDHEPFDHC